MLSVAAFMMTCSSGLGKVIDSDTLRANASCSPNEPTSAESELRESKRQPKCSEAEVKEDVSRRLYFLVGRQQAYMAPTHAITDRSLPSPAPCS